MPGKLDEYRRKRSADRTPEPVPATNEDPPQGNDDTFVVQEHHATALHWDFRLERNGVLVSWAVPKGLPPDPKDNHLAVQTEDHPLEYASFANDIPAGEYGGGTVTIWDSGTYVTEKWTDNEVKVVLSGHRVQGRFALIHTKGKNWIVHRMDAPAKPNWKPLPKSLVPMLATPAELPSPATEDEWAFETKWDGARALAFIDGGRIRLLSRNENDVSASYPELRDLGASVGTTQLLLDGEIVAFSDAGRPSFSRLQNRMHVTAAAEVRRLVDSDPIVYVIFDLLHHDGESLLDQTYEQRRAALEALDLNGSSWHTPAYFTGSGADLLRATAEQGLEGLVAKRLSSTYRPGRRSPDWRKIKNIRTQEVIIGGWREGQGNRDGLIGGLLMGIPGPDGLDFAGSVGTGFTRPMLVDLARRLNRLERKSSPFAQSLTGPERRGVHWVTPSLVGEVAYHERTPDGRLRHPAWRGLRPDKAPSDVVVEGT